VEEAVAFAIVGTWAISGKDITVVIDITGIKQLVELIARLAATGHVRSNIVEAAKAPGEGDMARVV